MSIKKERKSEELKKEFDAENLSRSPSPLEEATPDSLMEKEISEAEVGTLRNEHPEDTAEAEDYYDTQQVEEMVDDDAISPFEAGHIDGYTSGERTASCMLCREALFENPFESVIEGRRYNFCSEEHMQQWLQRRTIEGTEYSNIAGDEEIDSLPHRDQP